MTALHEDPRVVRGMEAQFAQRRRLLDAGARPLGWKLGVGTPAAMEQAGTSAPLVGFLTDATLLESGAEVAVGEWTKPGAEPEIAVHVAADVAPDAGPDEARAAIGGLGPAIEVVDIEVPMDAVEPIVGGDIFHRGVILGPAQPVEPGAVRADVMLEGQPAQAVDDPFGVVGDPAAGVQHVATFLAAFGETLRAGEVIILGSLVPLIAVAPGDALTHAVDPLGTLAVAFTA